MHGSGNFIYNTFSVSYGWNWWVALKLFKLKSKNLSCFIHTQSVSWRVNKRGAKRQGETGKCGGTQHTTQHCLPQDEVLGEPLNFSEFSDLSKWDLNRSYNGNKAHSQQIPGQRGSTKAYLLASKLEHKAVKWEFSIQKTGETHHQDFWGYNSMLNFGLSWLPLDIVN